MNEKGLSNIGPSTSLRMTVYASLMAALTAAGAFLAIPIGPVPIVLQNLFIFRTVCRAHRWVSFGVPPGCLRDWLHIKCIKNKCG